MFKTPVLVVALVTSSVLAAPPDADKQAGEGRILIWKEGKHVLLSPAGKALEELPANAKKFRLLKPDGKTVEIPFPEKSKLELRRLLFNGIAQSRISTILIAGIHAG